MYSREGTLAGSLRQFSRVLIRPMTSSKRHVVRALQFTKRRVPCNKTGRHHRHKYCVEEYVNALCGTEVVRGQDAYNDFDMLLHLGPAQDWCHRCLRVVAEDPGRAGQMKQEGFREFEAADSG